MARGGHKMSSLDDINKLPPVWRDFAYMTIIVFAAYKILYQMIGKTATLKQPYNGYSRIEIIGQDGTQWRVRILSCGKEISVYEDDFELD